MIDIKSLLGLGNRSRTDAELADLSDAVRKACRITVPLYTYGALVVISVLFLLFFDLKNIPSYPSFIRTDEAPMVMAFFAAVALPIGVLCGLIFNMIAQGDVRTNTLTLNGFGDKAAGAAFVAGVLVGGGLFGYFFLLNQTVPRWAWIVIAYCAICAALGAWLARTIALIYSRMLDLDNPR